MTLRRIRPRRRGKSPTRPTKPQLQMQAALRVLGVSFKRQYSILGKFFDFYLPRHNILIQVDGRYWHGKGLRIQQKNKIQVKNRANDILKNTIAKMRGIPLYRIWQGQINISSVKNILKRASDEKQKVEEA